MERTARERFEAVKARVAATDPTLVEAMHDVDPATLAFAASMSPLERLHAATQNAHNLSRFRRVTPPSG